MGFKEFHTNRQAYKNKTSPVTIVKIGRGRGLNIRNEVAEQIKLRVEDRCHLEIGVEADLGSFAVVAGGKRKPQVKGKHRMLVNITAILMEMGMLETYQKTPMFEVRDDMLVVWPGVSVSSKPKAGEEPEPEPEPEDGSSEDESTEAPEE